MLNVINTQDVDFQTGYYMLSVVNTQDVDL